MKEKVCQKNLLCKEFVFEYTRIKDLVFNLTFFVVINNYVLSVFHFIHQRAVMYETEQMLDIEE